MPVLQVPAGEERGPGGLPNIPKQGEKEEDGKGDWEKKKEDDVDEEEGMIVKYPLVPVTTFKAPASRFFPARRN